MLWNKYRQGLQCKHKYIKERLGNAKRTREGKLESKIVSGQGLPGEPGKHMWLTEAHTSQETPNSIRGSSSQIVRKAKNDIRI